MRSSAEPSEWERLDRHLYEGTMTLRDVLAAEAACIRYDLDEADAILVKNTRFDPTFAAFARRCRSEGVPMTVLSSGVEPLIRRAFEREGLADVPVRANRVDASPRGWRFLFRDASANGHDKAAAVRSARREGLLTAFVGDGHSDFEAALEADRRFAKRGRDLEAYLQKNGVEFTPFDRFNEVEAALF
ncbi:MAG: HAD-IB family phosphatase [Candidatus Eremiobacteraeota bacterium]|nr:HAD-IB family phosphatase [Candidatus Eremiobacteraeota bacterium]